MEFGSSSPADPVPHGLAGVIDEITLFGHPIVVPTGERLEECVFQTRTSVRDGVKSVEQILVLHPRFSISNEIDQPNEHGAARIERTFKQYFADRGLPIRSTDGGAQVSDEAPAEGFSEGTGFGPAESSWVRNVDLLYWTSARNGARVQIVGADEWLLETRFDFADVQG